MLLVLVLGGAYSSVAPSESTSWEELGKGVRSRKRFSGLHFNRILSCGSTADEHNILTNNEHSLEGLPRPTYSVMNIPYSVERSGHTILDLISIFSEEEPRIASNEMHPRAVQFLGETFVRFVSSEREASSGFLVCQRVASEHRDLVYYITDYDQNRRAPSALRVDGGLMDVPQITRVEEMVDGNITVTKEEDHWCLMSILLCLPAPSCRLNFLCNVSYVTSVARFGSAASMSLCAEVLRGMGSCCGNISIGNGCDLIMEAARFNNFPVVIATDAA